MNTIQSMKDVDIRTVDPMTLVDASNIPVRRELPRIECIRDFVRRVKNPYCFRIGDVAIKLSFDANGVTLTDRLESLMMKF